LIEYRPENVEALVLCGAVKRAAGRAREGLTELTQAIALTPENPQCLYELAMTWHSLGDNELALKYCAQAREAEPGFAPPRWLQAQILLGGEDYLAVLERIHAQLMPRTYIEIGVFQGESLRLARFPTQAIGIDPAPQLGSPLAPNQRLFTDTSDAFFSSHDVRAEFDALPIDLAFIDGMHHFEYALRDFINVERFSSRES